MRAAAGLPPVTAFYSTSFPLSSLSSTAAPNTGTIEDVKLTQLCMNYDNLSQDFFPKCVYFSLGKNIKLHYITL